MIGINDQYLVLGIRSTGSFRVKALHILPPQHVDKLVQMPRLGCPNLIVWSHLGDTKVTVIFWHLGKTINGLHGTWTNGIYSRASICIYIYKYVPRTHVTSSLGVDFPQIFQNMGYLGSIGIFITCYTAIPLHPIWSKHVGVKTSAEKQSNDVKKIKK